MSAPIVFHDTRRPQPLPDGSGDGVYLANADRRVRRMWPEPAGQLWERVAERAGDQS